MPPNERPEPTPWAADQLWMAHMAISQGKQHQVAERFGRSHSQAALEQPHDAQAGVIATPFHAWLDDWQLKANEEVDNADFNDLTLTAYSGEDSSRFGYTLELTAEGRSSSRRRGVQPESRQWPRFDVLQPALLADRGRCHP